MLRVEPSEILNLDNISLESWDTPGDRLTAHPAFQRLARSEKPFKAFSASFYFSPSQKTTLLTSTGPFTSIDNPGVFGLPSQQPFVFELLKSAPITASYVSNWQEGGSYVDVADVTAENAAAPEPSSWTMSAGTLPVRKIFSIARASEELFDDLPIFAQFINERLTRSTLQRLDYEIINGSGSGAHLTGLLGSGPTVIARGSTSRSDALLTALSRVRSVGFGTPNGIVMNHADALLLQTDKDDSHSYTAQLPGKFTDRAEPLYNFGGAPVLQTSAITAGNVLVGDWTGAILFMRRELLIESSATDADNWTKNVLTLRASLRATLLCHTPTKFVSITGFGS